ncbi:MAG: hypothetical protein HDR72_04690 [Ruminococcaceae bacterium]|nr:hypothetical protein [Oscillospiraceae bacterium]
MSLKSFDDFCAKIINNDPIPQKDIFDERQTIVRAQLTTRALWAFVIMSGINLLIMECGPQWCESWVLSTAFFGAIAYLYWVCANARRGSLFGIHGTATLSSQIGFLFGDSIFIPIAILSDKEPNDVIGGFFIRNGMVSDYFMIVLNGALLLTSGIVMAICVGNHRKREKAGKENDAR